MRQAIFTAIMLLALSFTAQAAAQAFRLDKSNDEVLQSLISTKASKFTVHTYSDDITGLAIQYNVYLPETEGRHPAVFFMADASAAGKEPAFSLTQGYGALVWPDDCIVIVPTYPEMILDDHGGFVLTDYVRLTERFVRWALGNYNIDTSRVYATGQSMGCMTWLVISAQNPGLFTACVFVSGQWDITALQGLREQKFVYVASLGDDKASKGQQEVIDMFTSEELPCVWYRNVDAKNPGVSIPVGQEQSFITFKAGTTLPEGTEAKYSEHMTSFDYAYKIAAVREWLLSQRKETN
ncbi:MAG: hypothetical protein IJS28_06100 [Synergistaceae bacterium]|nr:hypothetical protein [Synergistaceae bacterium]